MMSFLQTGKALMCGGHCLAGFYQAGGRESYKRLIKESTNVALTKNMPAGAAANAEDTYRINQE